MNFDFPIIKKPFFFFGIWHIFLIFKLKILPISFSQVSRCHLKAFFTTISKQVLLFGICGFINYKIRVQSCQHIGGTSSSGNHYIFTSLCHRQIGLQIYQNDKQTIENWTYFLKIKYFINSNTEKIGLTQILMA